MLTIITNCSQAASKAHQGRLVMEDEIILTTVKFQAIGGPLHGQSLESNGIRCPDGFILWPFCSWTADGYCYRLEFDENKNPTQFVYDPERNRMTEQ